MVEGMARPPVTRAILVSRRDGVVVCPPSHLWRPRKAGSMLALVRGTRVLRIALVLVASGLVGCGSERSHPLPLGESVPQVGRVVVALSSDLPTDRQARLDKLGATFMLKGALEAALTKAGKLDTQSPVALNVEITRFRMRSGATVFWFGAMAGGDLLDVRAAARDGDRTVRQLETGAGSIGAFAGLSQDSRFERLIRAVADRVVKAL